MASTEPRVGRNNPERGAVLLLALVLLTIGSFIVVSLANEVSTNLAVTNSLQNGRTAAYAADAALDAAIQQSRYHGQCESFPKSGTLQLQSGLYAYVACAGTPMAVTVTPGSSTIASATPAFVPQDVGQSVFDVGFVPFGTKITGYINATTASIAPTTATGSAPDSHAIVGSAGQRLEAFWACTSSSAINSCSSSTASGSAVVTFYDTDSTGDPGFYGYGMTIQSWVVAQANG